MAINLDTLPQEIILLLVDLGSLRVQDGLALRQTCRLLHEKTENRLFWSHLIKTNQSIGYILPFPPFRQASTLSTRELIQAAVRYTLTSANLASAEPKYRSHWRLPVEDSTPLPPINVFAILPNGHYALIMHESGVFTLWDLRPGSIPQSERRRLLARHRLPHDTFYMEYTVEGESGTDIIISAFSDVVDLPTVFIFELKLAFQSTDLLNEVPEVVKTDLTKFSVNSIRHFARVVLQDGICLAWYSPSSGGTNVMATIVDYRKGKRCDLETDIEAVIETQEIEACMCNGSLLFHRDGLASTVVYAYFDVKQHLQSVTASSRPGDIQTVQKPSDASATLSLQLPDPASRAHGDTHWGWTSVRPVNTPNPSTPRGYPSIFSCETPIRGTRKTGPHISARWMEPRTTLEMLKTEKRNETPLSRTWIDLHSPTGRRQWDGFDFMVSSTCGQRVLWVGHRNDVQPGQADSFAEQVLFFIPLLTPDDTLRGAAGKRILELPIPLDDRLVTMDFSDEAGTLVVAWKPDEDADDDDDDEPMESNADHILHIFQY